MTLDDPGPPLHDPKERHFMTYEDQVQADIAKQAATQANDWRFTKLITGAVLVALFALIAAFGYVDLINTYTDERIQTNKIAACVGSDDVVGCLEALK